MLLAATLYVATACSLPSIYSGSSPTPQGSPAAQLDAQVATPPGFPRDVPVYSAARLTAAAAFPSGTLVTYGMEWETLDSVAKVQAWYGQRFNQADWTITISASTAESFAATFDRKSNSHVRGTLGATSVGGLTRIQMSLVAPPG